MSGPDMVSRGFVYVRDSSSLMHGAHALVKVALERCEARHVTDWSSIKMQVREVLAKYLFEQTGRRPMVLPIIMEA